MQRRGKGRTAVYGIALGVLLGLALVGASLLSVATGAGGTAGLASGVGPRELGPRDARVQLVLYFDFQCTHCDDLHAGAEAEVIRRYVATGKAHLEARPVPFLGAESQRAAEASLCAGDQSRFWEYRDALFAMWRLNGPSVYSTAGLKEMARRTALNTDAFAACLDGGAKRAELAEIARQAQADNVKSVPSLAINGQAVLGAQPLEKYIPIIEGALQP